MNIRKILGAAAMGLMVVVVVLALPEYQVPALPPPVTLRSQAILPEGDRNSLVIVPGPVFELERETAQTPDEPDEAATADEESTTPPPAADTADTPDTEAVDEPDEDPVDVGDASTVSADSPDVAASADSIDSPDD